MLDCSDLLVVMVVVCVCVCARARAGACVRACVRALLRLWYWGSDWKNGCLRVLTVVYGCFNLNRSDLPRRVAEVAAAGGRQCYLRAK